MLFQIQQQTVVAHPVVVLHPARGAGRPLGQHQQPHLPRQQGQHQRPHARGEEMTRMLFNNILTY